MGYYCKRPVIVEVEGPITEEQVISTLEGDMTASVGDYIITGLTGERYPCKPDIFHKTYYEVTEDVHHEWKRKQAEREAGLL